MYWNNIVEFIFNLISLEGISGLFIMYTWISSGITNFKEYRHYRKVIRLKHEIIKKLGGFIDKAKIKK